MMFAGRLHLTPSPGSFSLSYHEGRRILQPADGQARRSCVCIHRRSTSGRDRQVCAAQLRSKAGLAACQKSKHTGQAGSVRATNGLIFHLPRHGVFVDARCLSCQVLATTAKSPGADLPTDLPHGPQGDKKAVGSCPPQCANPAAWRCQLRAFCRRAREPLA